MLRVAVALVVALAAARGVGRVAVRLGQPRVVGEIVAGVLIGPSVLGALSTRVFPTATRPTLQLVGEVGVAAFAFVVGLRLDRRGLTRQARPLVLVSAASLLGPVALGLVLAAALYTPTLVPAAGTATAPGRLAFAVAVATLLSVSALPVMARILQEEGHDRTAVGTLAVGAGAVTTVLMFHLLQVATALAADAAVVVVLGRVATSAGLVAVLLGGVGPTLERVARSAPAVAGALAVGTAAGAALATRSLGLSVMVGAFLAGVATPRVREVAGRVEARVAPPVLGVLLPVFLVVSGLSTDLRGIDRPGAIAVAVLLVAAVVAKVVPVWVAARLAGTTPGQARQLGVLLDCRGLMVLVASMALLAEGLVTPVVHVAAVVIAVVTTLVTAPAYRVVGDRPAALPVAVPVGEAVAS